MPRCTTLPAPESDTSGQEPITVRHTSQVGEKMKSQVGEKMKRTLVAVLMLAAALLSACSSTPNPVDEIPADAPIFREILQSEFEQAYDQSAQRYGYTQVSPELILSQEGYFLGAQEGVYLAAKGSTTCPPRPQALDWDYQNGVLVSADVGLTMLFDEVLTQSGSVLCPPAQRVSYFVMERNDEQPLIVAQNVQLEFFSEPDTEHNIDPLQE